MPGLDQLDASPLSWTGSGRSCAEAQQARLVEKLKQYDWSQGAGPKLRQLLLRGVGVHHAGVLPKYRRIVEAVDIPVIGCGGISTAQDALEFLLAGASAVQVGTAAFTDPGILVAIVEGIESYLLRHGHSGLREIVGSARAEERR